MARSVSFFLILSFCFGLLGLSPAHSEDLDTLIFRNFNASSPTLDSLMVVISDGSIPLELGTTAALWFWEPQQGREAAVLSSAALASALGISVGTKTIVKRTRPYDQLANVNVLGSSTDTYSFPSGHTALAYSFATILSQKYQKWALPLWGFATAVGFSRVYTGHHYPSDVIGGAIAGYISGRCILANEDFFLSLAGLRKGREVKHSFLVYPTISKEYQSVAISCSL